jgi:hypothetical protein
MVEANTLKHVSPAKHCVSKVTPQVSMIPNNISSMKDHKFFDKKKLQLSKVDIMKVQASKPQVSNIETSKVQVLEVHILNIEVSKVQVLDI